MALAAGQIIDQKYRITRMLGEGGMGAVFEGENTRIHRKVAIKVLHASVAEKSDIVQRFEREAQAAGRIGSRHIVEVLDLGILPEGDRFMVMEYLDGESLGDRLERLQQLTPKEIFAILRQLLDGLQAAHQAGIIHRDLKPDNVFLVTTGSGEPDFVKIVDFGVSKFSPLAHEQGMQMTQTGAVMGTPYYMSPEQATGAKGSDHRADLFSVGVILFEAITGRVPFTGDTFNELMFKIACRTPHRPRTLCKASTRTSPISSARRWRATHSIGSRAPRNFGKRSISGSRAPTSRTQTPGLRPRLPSRQTSRSPGRIKTVHCTIRTVHCKAAHANRASSLALLPSHSSSQMPTHRGRFIRSNTRLRRGPTPTHRWLGYRLPCRRPTSRTSASCSVGWPACSCSAAQPA